MYSIRYISILIVIFLVGCQSTNYKQDFKLALKSSNYHKIDKALLAGIDINGDIGGGISPLVYALAINDEELVTYLLRKGANPNQKVSDGINPDIMPLHYTAVNNHAKMAKLLIEKGANVNFKVNQYDDTPIGLAVLKGNTEVAKVLLNSGADVHSPNITPTGIHIPLLISAIMDGNTDLTKLLLDAGAKPNELFEIDKGIFWTPAFYTLVNKPNIIPLLVSFGADINKPNSDGLTPIHYAVTKGEADLVQMLLNNNVNCNYEDPFNKFKPKQVARRSGFTSITQLLSDCEG